MFKLGGILFALGIMGFLGAQLQYNDFSILLPNYILIICGTGFLLWAEWKHNKNPQKKISIFAILCFILGFAGFLVTEGNNWFYFATSALSIVCGVIFKMRYRKGQAKLVGNTLFVTGIIMGGIVFLLSSLTIIFP